MKNNIKKGLVYTLVLAQTFFSSGVVWALPTGGKVTSGSASIVSSGNTLTVNQKTNSGSINWQTFNISSEQTVKFVQPNSSSLTINTILGNSASQIFGKLSANGQVWLLNPNGVLFGAGSIIDTHGLIASALTSVTTSPNQIELSGTGKGSVVNNGTISGTYIALAGNQVVNNGSLTGKAILLLGGTDVTLSGLTGGNVGFVVNKSTLNNLASNTGVISANGGYVALSAGAKDSLLASAVNNSGVIEAENLTKDQSGQIVLLSGMDNGTTTVSGVLNASAPNGGSGGFIETSGNRVNVDTGTTVSTNSVSGQSGTWLIDPSSFYIGENRTGTPSSTLGDILNYEDISASTLENALASSNVIIDSSQGTHGNLGNVYVDSAISVNTSHSLTLNAATNVQVNQNIVNSGTGTISLRADDMGIGGQTNSGGPSGTPSGIGTVNIAPGVVVSTGGALEIYSNPTNYNTAIVNPSTGTAYVNGNSSGSVTAYDLLSTKEDLYYIDQNQTSQVLDNNYVLNDNISLPNANSLSLSANDLAQVRYATTINGYGYTAGSSTNSNWERFGGNNAPYIGNIDGLNHSIENINIYDCTHLFSGFIGVWNGTLIKSFGVVNSLINTSGYKAGILIALNRAFNSTGIIKNSYSTGFVIGGTCSGGLVGTNSGIIINSHSNVVLNGACYSGGLVGTNTESYQSNVYVEGQILNSYAEGKVSANCFAGGIAGYNYGNAQLKGVYSTASVKGGVVGGLVGCDFGTISSSYAAGSLKALSSGVVGGIVGNLNTSSPYVVENSYWNTTTTGVSRGVGADCVGTPVNLVGLTTSQFAKSSNFSYLNFNNFSNGAFTSSLSTNPWVMGELTVGSSTITAPILASDMPTETITANFGSKNYNTTSTDPNGVTTSINLGGTSLSSNLIGYSGSANVGTNEILPTVSSSYVPLTQNGPGSFNLTPGWVTVAPANLNASTTATKTYNGNPSITLNGTDTVFTGVGGQYALLSSSESETLNQSGIGNNIGGVFTNAIVGLTGFGGFDISNYILPRTFTGGSITAPVVPPTPEKFTNTIQTSSSGPIVSPDIDFVLNAVNAQNVVPAQNVLNAGPYVNTETNYGIYTPPFGGPVTVNDGGVNLKSY